MMRWQCLTIIFIIAGIFCVTQKSQAQTPHIDSLRTEYNNTSSDSIKIELLLQMSSKYRYINADSSINWMKTANHIAKLNNFEKEKAKTIYHVGVGFHIKGALDSAYYYYSNALPHLISIKDSSGISSVTNNIGLIELNRGNYTEAIKHIRHSATIDEELGNLPGQASSLNNIGLIYRGLNDYDHALDYYFKSEKIQIQLNNDFRLVQLYNNIGMVKEEQHHFDSAKYYYKKSLLKAYAPDSKCHRANALIGLGKIYFINQQIDSSTFYAKQAIAISDDCKKPKILAIAKLLTGQIDLKIGKINSAKLLLTEAYNLAIKHELKPEIEQSAFRFYQFYKKIGNYKKALIFFELHEKTKTEILNEEKIREVTRLEVSHQAEQKRQQLIAKQKTERLNFQKEKESEQFQKEIILLISVILLILAISISRAYVVNKKNNEKLSTLNNELFLKNDKLNKLDDYRIRFLANINHDIRTPLTLIKGRLEQINNNHNNYLTEKTEKNLHQIAESVNTLQIMSEEIQNLANIEEGKIELNWREVVFSELTKSIIQLFSSRAEIEFKKLNLKQKTDKKQKIHLDPILYQRILTNLLSNAFKFTRSGDSIIVEIEEGDAFVLVSVIDTGIGIPSEDQPHIFDRFYQSSENPHSDKQGFGIGLTLVKELAAAHNGNITVTSKLGSGSRFKLKLPYNFYQEIESENIPLEPQLENEIIQPAYQKINLSNSDKPTIMVVEDHQAVRDYIVEIIGSDYQIKEASHGKQALEILENTSVDLILTDLMMPWMDGFELIKELKESEFSKIPIMVVSARTSDDDKMKVLGLGVNDFISKPFNTKELHGRIKNLISRTGETNSWNYIANNNNIKNNIEKDILYKVHNLVLEKINDPNLNLNTLAEVLCASTRKVHTLIKSLTGKPPKAYIKTIRLEYAQQLIRSKKVHTLVEAANAIGMKNGTEFKQQYQKQFGQFPFE